MSEAEAPGASAAPSEKSNPRARTFNWPACCGNSCVSGFLVLLIAAVSPGSLTASLRQHGAALRQTVQEVSSASLTTIKTQAKVVDSRELAAEPFHFQTVWLSVEGRLLGQDRVEAGWGSSLAVSSTEYGLDPEITVLDLSAKPAVGREGDEVVAIGKIVLVDMGRIPLIGKRWVEVLGLEGYPKILLISKEVSLADATEDAIKPDTKPDSN